MIISIKSKRTPPPSRNKSFRGSRRGWAPRRILRGGFSFRVLRKAHRSCILYSRGERHGPGQFGGRAARRDGFGVNYTGDYGEDGF